MKKWKVILGISLITLLIIGGFMTNNILKSQELKEKLDLGNKYIQEGNYDQAILAYTEAIRIDPKIITARAGLTVAYVETGRFDDARNAMKEIEQLGVDKLDKADAIRIADSLVKHEQVEDAVSLLKLFYESNKDPEIKKLIANIIITKGWNPGLEKIETIILSSADSTGDDSANVLENGQHYLIKASGTFTYNLAGDWADAKHSLKNGVVEDCNWFHVIEDGSPIYFDKDWGYNDDSHEYSLAYTGAGIPLHFYIEDNVYRDNSGSLTVDIWKVNI